MDKLQITEFVSNGLSVVHMHTDSRFSNIMFYTGIGAYCETPAKRGTAHFLEHMMFKGTESRTWEEINEEASFYAMDHNAFTSHYGTAYSIGVNEKFIEPAMDLLCDQMFNSTFPKKELDSEKTVIHEECTMYANDPNSVFWDNILSNLSNKQLATTVIGTHDTIEKISTTDIKKFHAKYNNSNTYLLICSSKSTKDVKKLCKKYLKQSTLGDNDTPTPNVTPAILQNYDDVKVSVTGATQTRIGMIFNSPPISVRPVVFDLMMEVLEGTTSSILYKNIREEQGLCYFIYGTELASNSEDAVYAIVGATSPDKSEQYKSSVVQCIRDMVENGVTELQLETAKNNMLDGAYRIIENPAKLLPLIGSYKTNNVAIASLDDNISNIENASLTGLNQYIAEFFSEEFFEDPYYVWVEGEV
jgi:predicted Zn-dependent peptidase